MQSIISSHLKNLFFHDKISNQSHWFVNQSCLFSQCYIQPHTHTLCVYVNNMNIELRHHSNNYEYIWNSSYIHECTLINLEFYKWSSLLCFGPLIWIVSSLFRFSSHTELLAAIPSHWAHINLKNFEFPTSWNVLFLDIYIFVPCFSLGPCSNFTFSKKTS